MAWQCSSLCLLGRNTGRVLSELSPPQHPNIKLTSSNAKEPTGRMTNDLPLNSTKSPASWFSDLCFFVYFGLSVNSIEGTDLWSGMVFIPGPWEFE